MGKSKSSKRDNNTHLLAGIAKHFAKVKSVTLKGKEVKVSGIVTGINTSIAASADTDAKRAAYLESAKTSRDADAAIEPTVLAFVDLLKSTLSAKDLADFNLQPKTRAVPDVATKAQAVKKRAATRKARGTMGKNQRKKIVGVVDEGAPAAGGTANGAAKPAAGTPAT
jgi:hypothetical protein